MTIAGPQGVPGMKTARSTGDFANLMYDAKYLPGGGSVAGSITRDYGNTGDEATIRQGMILRRQSNGTWGRGLLGLLGTAYASGTSLTVGAAAAQNIVKSGITTGNLYIVGPTTTATSDASINAEAVSFSAINTTTGVMTVTALARAYTAGSMLLAFNPMLAGGTGGQARHTEGLAILDRLGGIKVTDADGNDIDQPVGELAVEGLCIIGGIVDVPSDAYLRNILALNLRANSGLRFSDTFGF